MPPRFGLLIGAQFASALADNALLIVAIALLLQQGLPGWWAPLLKFGFTLSYVLLAPFVGPLADAFAKARVMAAMNLVKVIGVLALLAGVHPVAALAVVGFGAAAYAPAKYGLVTELVSADGLVAANAWLEISVVCAVLLGTVLGGFLIGPWVVASGWSRQTQSWASAQALTLSLLLLLVIYALASALNLGGPHSGARYPRSTRQLSALLRSFSRANRALWRDVEGGLSLAATTILWGVGATLQFAVLRWAVDRLGLTLDRATYLQAAVAVGVVVGASVAGRWVPLRHAKRVLAAGVLMGCLIPLAASLRELTAVVLLLALIGFIGGFMVVPLNALLQHRGCLLLTAGRSIAVQGFNENLSVLVMLAVYAALLALDVPIVITLWLLGVFVAAAVGVLLLREHRRGSGLGVGGARSRKSADDPGAAGWR
jgi:MFS transporter, LPLT family, lysophospholipid transporter